MGIHVEQPLTLVGFVPVAFGGAVVVLGGEPAEPIVTRRQFYGLMTWISAYGLLLVLGVFLFDGMWRRVEGLVPLVLVGASFVWALMGRLVSGRGG